MRGRCARFGIAPRDQVRTAQKARASDAKAIERILRLYIFRLATRSEQRRRAGENTKILFLLINYWYRKPDTRMFLSP